MLEDKYFDIALNEYNALRTEINNAMTNQQSILNYGIASIGVIVAFAASKWQELLVIDIILVVFVPLIGLLVSTIWLGEVNRISRAGKFLVYKEAKINEIFMQFEKNDPILYKEQVLIWENYLRDLKKNGNSKSIKTIWNYRAILMLISILSISSIFIGIYHYALVTRSGFLGIVIALALLFILGFIYMFLLLNKIKKEYTYVSVDGGGSRTRVLVSKNGKDKEVLVLEGGLNHKKNSNYQGVIKQVFQYVDSEVGISRVDRFIFGISGIDSRQDMQIMKRAIKKYIRHRFRLMNDIFLLTGFFRKNVRNYIIAISGTGSNVLSNKNGKIISDSLSGVATNGGIRHVMDYLIKNTDNVSQLPAELHGVYGKYMDKRYDINDMIVIEDFKKAAIHVFDNMDNEQCLKAAKYGIDEIVRRIADHANRFHRYFNLYLYGGQFKTPRYKDLFVETLQQKNLDCLSIGFIDEEPVIGGIKLIS